MKKMRFNPFHPLTAHGQKGKVMKLWILRPIETDGYDPWEPWYDKAFGFVVRAKTEADARKIAHEKAGCENDIDFEGQPTSAPWLDHKYSTCIHLENTGEEGMIIRDYASA